MGSDVPETTKTELILGTAVGAIAGGVGISFRRCEVKQVPYATARIEFRSPNGASRAKVTLNLTKIVVRQPLRLAGCCFGFTQDVNESRRGGGGLYVVCIDIPIPTTLQSFVKTLLGYT